MKKNRKVVYVEDTVFADKETGEVVKGSSKKVIRISQEPDYVKLYLNTVMYISDIPEGISSVMKVILKKMPFADKKQKIVLTKTIKDDIAEELGVSASYVRKAIGKLTKGKLLFHTGSIRSSCYIVNPHIFGRGEWKDIEELQLHVKFNSEGKTFWGEVKKSKEDETLVDFLERKATEQADEKLNEFLTQTDISVQ